METVEASTLVYLSPEEVYEFLVDFQQYEPYSEYVTNIDREGEADAGAVYDITASWWKITYTGRVKVTDVDPPTRIDWEVTKDVDASGYFELEHVPEEAPEDKPDATRVRCHAAFDLESADEEAFNLPGFVPLDRIIDRVKPKLKTVAHVIIRRMIADLEGEKRDVPLNVHKTPISV